MLEIVPPLASLIETLVGTSITETLWGESIAAATPANVFVSHVGAKVDVPLRWTSTCEPWPSTAEQACTFGLIFCVNPYEAATFASTDWSDTFSNMVQSLVTPAGVPSCTHPSCIARTWCIWEIHCTLRTRCDLTIGTSATENTALDDMRSYDRAIATLAAIDAESAQDVSSRQGANRRGIVAAGGFGAIDSAVRGRLLAELLARALAHGAPILIRSLVEAGATLETEVGVRPAALPRRATHGPAWSSGVFKERGQLDDVRTRCRGGLLHPVARSDCQRAEQPLRRHRTDLRAGMVIGQPLRCC